MDLFLQQLVSGISIGAIYALLAVGYALVYSIYNFTNWAFDAFMAFGAIMAFTAIASLAMPFWMAAILAIILTIMLAVGTERLAYRPLRTRKAPRLFMIYDEGNFIEATEATPYFQIGETKYGKPIIDRVIQAQTPLMDAVKCVLVSFDSTMRSNIAVGLPIDLACYARDSLTLDRVHHITDGDAYFAQISKRWSEGLRGVFASLPDPDWEASPGGGSLFTGYPLT